MLVCKAIINENMDKKIPALGGNTPRQAVKTAEGREGVEALLLEGERHVKADALIRECALAAIEKVRRQLGLGKKR